ncbi:MAG TPA: DUF4382 domain-containing protein [Candidatus Bathyarchaeia archaeon]
MTNGKRHNAIFGAAGILAALLIIAGFAAFQAQAKGVLTIQVMDAPVELKNLYLTIDWIRIQGENGWENLTLKTAPDPFYFDLLTLQNVSETLSITEIPAGNYSMIQMHVLDASATYPDDSTATLNVPSDVIKVLLKPHMEIEPGGQVTVLIDLQPEDLNTIAISHSLNLRSVVKAVVS